MKVIFVERKGFKANIEVFVYSINLSKRIVTVRNYCNYKPSVLVVYSSTFSSLLARQFLDTVDCNDPVSVHDFFAFVLKHGSMSCYKTSYNPFFTSSGKIRSRFLDLL